MPRHLREPRSLASLTQSADSQADTRREDMSRQMERPAQVYSPVDFVMKNRLEIFTYFGPLGP
jgi:hypothetical protein